MSNFSQPENNTLLHAQKSAELAGEAAKKAGLPEAQIEAAKATAIGTVTALRELNKA